MRDPSSVVTALSDRRIGAPALQNCKRDGHKRYNGITPDARLPQKRKPLENPNLTTCV